MAAALPPSVLGLDAVCRVVSDAATTLGSGVDGSVRRIEYAYDGQGNQYLVTSYDAASGGSIVNQVERAFNGLGQMTTEWQEHSGAVNTSTSTKVQYAYSEMPSGADHSRLTSITYPDGYVLTYNYSSGLNDSISRLSSLSDSTGTLEAYSYMGLATVVVRSHPQIDVDLTFVGTPGDAGDQYAGLDRFGRVVDQLWENTSTSTATDEFQYAYDVLGNRTSMTNAVNSAFDESYTYDDLNQLTGFSRGSHTQDFNYDAVGNFDSVTTDGGTAQTRSANAQNEITSISGATTPTYDANGNMTGDETGKQFVYDAWNRLVTVKDSGGTTLKTYGYDGLNRRMTETVSGTTTDLYFSDQWQVLEKRVGNNTTERYVWSPVYVDAMVLRDRDTDANGTLDERLWVQQDANFNVTALVNGSGTVVERYAYDPYGAVTIYDASYTVRASSSYGWTVLWQGMVYDSVSASYKSRGRTDISPTLGRPFQPDPIRFAAGDVNFYRWEGNSPMNNLDPSGLEVPGYHHFYSLFLGGNDAQMLFELNEAEHKAAHDVLRKHDVGRKQGLSYDQARANWAKLTPAKQREIILEAMKAADIPDSLAKKYIDHVFDGASPGTNNSPTRKTPKQSQLFDRAELEKARKEAKAIEKAAKEAAEKAAKKPGPVKKVLKWGGKRIPGVGIGVTLFFWGEDVQAKGLVGGTVNSALDAIPFGGAGKGVIELFTGDWIPDKDANNSPSNPLIPSVLPINPFHEPGSLLPSRWDQIHGNDYRRRILISPTLGQFRMQPTLPRP